jgi:hypothetical protein
MQVGESASATPSRREDPPAGSDTSQDGFGEADDAADNFGFTFDDMRIGQKDIDQDTEQSGWRTPRHLKRLVKFLVLFGYRGHSSEQDLVAAALKAYLPSAALGLARSLAREGRLDDLPTEMHKRMPRK